MYLLPLNYTHEMVKMMNFKRDEKFLCGLLCRAMPSPVSGKVVLVGVAEIENRNDQKTVNC